MAKATARKTKSAKSSRKTTPAGTKKFMLTCQDRIFLLETLPDRESRATMMLMRKLRERLGLNEKEIKEIDFQESKDGRLTAWKKPGRAKGINFSAFELAIVEQGLKKMDDEKQLRDQHLELCDKFLGKSATKNGAKAD